MTTEKRQAIFVRESLRDLLVKVAKKNKRTVPEQLEWWALNDHLLMELLGIALRNQETKGRKVTNQ